MGNTSEYLARLSKREEMQEKKETMLYLLKHRETLLSILAQGESSLIAVKAAIMQAQSIPGADQAMMWKTHNAVVASIRELREKDLMMEAQIHELGLETGTVARA
jgi:hypothetical protein